MIIAIHQPQYLPWIGYFSKMMAADAFCLLDTVQYKKNEWQNRNRIKTALGWQWLSVPVHYRYPDTIDRVEIDNRSRWDRKHLQAIVTNYRRAPYFDRYFPVLEEILTVRWERLVDLNVTLIRAVRDLLVPADFPIYLASDFDRLKTDPTGRLVDICQRVGAETYLSGPDGANYMDLRQFTNSGIQLRFHRFQHPEYPQAFEGFLSHMSVFDLLFHCGPESAQIIRASTIENETEGCQWG